MEFEFEYVIQIGDAKSDQIDCIAEIAEDTTNGHDGEDWYVEGIRVKLTRLNEHNRFQEVIAELPQSHPMYAVLKGHVESLEKEVSPRWSAHIANHIRPYHEAAE